MTAMPQQKPRRSRWGIALITVGLVLGIGGLVLGIVLSIVGFSSAAGGKEVFESGHGSVELKAGDEVQFYAHPDRPIHCQVHTPDGSPLDRVDGQDSTLNDWKSFVTIRAKVDGSYSFECDNPVMVGTPVSAGGIIAGLGGIGMAIVSMVVGVLLLIVGIILVVRARKANKATPAVPYGSPSPIAPDAPSQPATPYRPAAPQQQAPNQGQQAPGQGQQPPSQGQQGGQYPGQQNGGQYPNQGQQSGNQYPGQQPPSGPQPPYGG